MHSVQTTDKYSRRIDLLLSGARCAPQGRGTGHFRGGFTLIEILIAISVIFILMAIVFVALKYSAGAGKSAQTRVSLQTIQSMYSELEASASGGGIKNQPAGWFWWRGGPIDGADDGFINGSDLTVISAGLKFWTAPFTFNGVCDALTAPGLMGDDPTDTSTLGGNLVASPAILNTQLAMSFLLAVSNNRAAFDRLPQDQKMSLAHHNGAFIESNEAALPYPANGWIGFADNGVSKGVVYGRGNRVVRRDTVAQTETIYRVEPTGGSLTLSANPPPPGTGWVVDTRNTPLLKDGWGHPIIFVPPGGLRVRLLNGESAFDPNNVDQCAIVISPPGKVGRATVDPKLPFVIAPGRPFFASAGPDGDFSKGDDNIYSFDSQ